MTHIQPTSPVSPKQAYFDTHAHVYIQWPTRPGVSEHARHDAYVRVSSFCFVILMQFRRVEVRWIEIFFGSNIAPNCNDIGLARC